MCVLYTFELLILFAVSDIFEEEDNMLIITINSIAEDLLISNMYIQICVCVCVCVCVHTSYIETFKSLLIHYSVLYQLRHTQIPTMFQ